MRLQIFPKAKENQVTLRSYKRWRWLVYSIKIPAMGTELVNLENVSRQRQA